MSEPHPSSAGPMKIGNWTHQTAPETDSSLSSLFSHHNRQCQKEEKRGRSGSGSRCGSAERCDLLSFLRDLRIHPDLALSYCNMMRDNGYDDVLAVRDAEEVELRELGIKVGHVRRMRRAAQGECTGGASPPSRTISPPLPAAARHRPHSIEGGGGNPPAASVPRRRERRRSVGLSPERREGQKEDRHAGPPDPSSRRAARSRLLT